MAVQITERAFEELKKLDIGEERVIRISVEPGGCAGMTYTAGIDEGVHEDDAVVFDHEGVRVVSQKVAAGFLEGLEIDYSDDLVRSGFRFSNENASGSCGCGASFTA